MKTRGEPTWLTRLLSAGKDPDPRFSLANERTFLAWMRTALGMVALGVGVATFVSTHTTRGASLAVAATLVLLGGCIAALSWTRWLHVERAMRDGRGVPPSHVAPILAIGIGAVSAFAVVTVIVQTVHG